MIAGARLQSYSGSGRVPAVRAWWMEGHLTNTEQTNKVRAGLGVELLSFACIEPTAAVTQDSSFARTPPATVSY